MKTIIGFTDSINECDCCGKTDLKGTFCVEVDGDEFYYGSVCAFKEYGISKEDQKIAKSEFSKKEKIKKLYALHILPIEKEMAEKLESTFTTTDYEGLTGFAKKIHDSIVRSYKQSIEFKIKKYNLYGAI